MATKQLSSIYISLQIRGDTVTADGTVEWTSPDVPEAGTLHIPVALIASGKSTVAELAAACDAAAEAALQRGSDTIEKPTRPKADAAMEGR